MNLSEPVKRMKKKKAASFPYIYTTVHKLRINSDTFLKHKAPRGKPVWISENFLPGNVWIFNPSSPLDIKKDNTFCPGATNLYRSDLFMSN